MKRRLPIPGKTGGGFTLIEILLSLLVITVGITTAIGLLSSSLDSSSRAHGDSAAVSFADMVFSCAHAVTNWTDLPTTGTFAFPDYSEGTAELPLNTVSRFTCTVPGSGGAAERWTVTYRLRIAGAPFSADVRQLTLEVWPGFSTNHPPNRFYTEVYNWKKEQ